MLTKFLVVALSVGFGYWYQTLAPHVVSRHSNLESHVYYSFPELWDPKEAESLREWAKSIPYVNTQKADATGKLEHIGEDEDVLPDGTCANKFLIPNGDRTRCIFPARFDVARHQAMSGGFMGHKESMEAMGSRLVVFQAFFHAAKVDISRIPEVSGLFESDKYMSKARELCASESHGNSNMDTEDLVLDPVQLSIIVLLPGQEVAMHYDAPWFFGAGRFDLPVWLLVAMERSKLFADVSIPQVQGVAYLHPPKNTSVEKGGFFYYPKGTAQPYQIAPAQFNSAIILNGAQVVHGTETYRPDAELPPIRKDETYDLQHVGDDKWELRVRDPKGGEGRLLKHYSTDELRISFVWRQRCFWGDSERSRFMNPEEPISLERVLSVFRKDLKAKGLWNGDTDSELTTSEAFALGRQIVDEYITYPFSEQTWFPYNLCALEVVAPFLKPALSMVC